MPRSTTSTGLVIAVVAALTFGLSGAFAKPLLEAGWSPAAAVTVRSLVGGLVLTPFAAVALRGRWNALWRNRWRIVATGAIGVAATQLTYFAALERVPVGTAILLEYMAPLLLVAVAWARSRRRPQSLVLIGSVVALVGLVLVVAPGSGVALDPVGLLFAVGAMVGCAIYYVVAAAPPNGLPAVALAAFGLLLGAASLALAGVVRLVPFKAPLGDVPLFGSPVAWWVPVVVIGVVATAIAYTANIAAAERLGSRLASFAGLLEVVAATFYAWLLLGERLTVPQLLGGGAILVGIACVRAARSDAPTLVLPIAVDPTPTGSVPIVPTPAQPA